ncbi:MAG: gliding motility lipoprotein GldD [Bacteroidia bacterium]|jgi:gliding motility-associated lipoprotein GldD|nr:gliding motility lipoprotein GldD [Bacteroidota bacterium]
MRNTFFIFSVFLLAACSSDTQTTPRPRGYERIEFPAKEYDRFYVNACHYSFELPKYALVRPDPYPAAEECWYNVYYKPFGATLHLSYRPVKNRTDLFKLFNDSREMVFKHVMRADQIVENYIQKPNYQGIYYELDGSTATNAQFYVTDSTHHFLRGSLYFNTKTNQDSIAPVLKFLKEDMLRLIETLEWEK